MKHKNDIMCVTERRNRVGELSFELRCSGKDPLTRKNKVYVKTVKVPTRLTGKKEIEQFRLKAQLEWKEEVKKRSSGITVRENNILFIDYASEYVENILKYKQQSYNYYRTFKDYLPYIKEKLGAYTLSEMTPMIIQNFCNWLCTRTYTKYSVTVKESLRDYIKKERKLTLVTVAKNCGLAHNTLFQALQVGATISKNTADKLCDFLNVPAERYFDIKKEIVPYSYSANNGIKTFIHGVLQSAVRQRLIEHNYASKDYILPVTGTKGEKLFLDTEEIHQFISCLNTETDLRKKSAFACYIYLGLRNAEVAGLAWKNIDFEKNEMAITQNTIYVKGFGTITKTTKTEKSKRIISMPSALTEILSQYKIWWDSEKLKHGDLWANTDKLFVQNSGKDMNGFTLSAWLKAWERKHGLKEVTPHGLRHSNITFAIANGIDVKTVSARAGHSDIQTTLNIYAHYSKEADKQAADKINELLSV